MVLKIGDHRLGIVFCFLLSVYLAACRGVQPPATAENVDVASSVTAAVMTAIAQVEGTPPATTAPDAATSDTAAGTAVAATCRTLQELNFRFGPGLSYDPPIRTLPPDTPLTPLAFSAIGYPGGQWLQVRDGSGEVGWVSAGSPFVACDVALTTLPPAASIPPTPTRPPTPSPTPVEVAGLPPHVTNNAPGGTAADYADGQVIPSDGFLFRMRVADTRFGTEDGAGIDYVEFIITTPDGDPVYFRRENTAAYCVFAGSEPNCNPWPTTNGRYVWGEGGPVVQAGDYEASILVYPQDPDFEGEVWNWDFEFELALPQNTDLTN